MAHPGDGPHPALTAPRLALLKELTQALTQAVLAGDLSRAEWLLAQRQAAFGRLSPGGFPAAGLVRDLAEIWEMDRELIEFCRTWHAIVQERLAQLAAHQRLCRRYYGPAPSPSLIQVRE